MTAFIEDAIGATITVIDNKEFNEKYNPTTRKIEIQEIPSFEELALDVQVIHVTRLVGYAQACDLRFDYLCLMKNTIRPHERLKFRKSPRLRTMCLCMCQTAL